MQTTRIMFINGPNLNMLGIREPAIYGHTTYTQLESYITSQCEAIKIEAAIFQSNYEGEIINFIQEAYHEKYDGLVINPGAYTHYSYAIADALKSVNIPCIEVHLSNIYQREAFRQKSVTAAACLGSITGLGKIAYILAAQALQHHLAAQKEN